MGLPVANITKSTCYIASNACQVLTLDQPAVKVGRAIHPLGFAPRISLAQSGHGVNCASRQVFPQLVVPHLFGRGDAIQTGHADIDKDQMRMRFAEYIEGLRTAVCFAKFDLDWSFPKAHAEQSQAYMVVVDDPDSKYLRTVTLTFRVLRGTW